MELNLFRGVVRKSLPDWNGMHILVLALDKVEAIDYIQQTVRDTLGRVPTSKILISQVDGPFKSGRLLVKLVMR